MEEIWKYGKEMGAAFFSDGGSDINYYAESAAKNYLITFSWLVNQANVDSSVIEISAEAVPQIVHEVEFSNNAFIYRSERMPLYPENWSYQFPGANMEIYRE